MNSEVRRQLSELNGAFYRQFARSFAESRREPQPGFYQLVEYLPRPCPRFLDVGCGEGRLGRFLLSQGRVDSYEGIDASLELIDVARQSVAGRFWQRDLARPGALEGLAAYEGVACLAVLQHIPGRKERVRLLAEMSAHLAPGGRLLLSTWQFLSSERQRKKVVEWSLAGLSPGEVEPDDYLLTWRRGGMGLRYVCFIDEEEVVSLAEAAGLQVEATFRADGREGDLNLYSVTSRDEVSSWSELT